MRNTAQAALVLLLMYGSAHASEWVSIGESEDGHQEMLVDVSSIRVASGIRRAWIKFVNAPHTVRGTGSESSKWAAYSVTNYSFNCTEGTSRAEALTTYYEDGTNYSVPNSSFSGSWTPVPPDTLVNGQLDFICAWRPMPTFSMDSSAQQVVTPAKVVTDVKIIHQQDGMVRCGIHWINVVYRNGKPVIYVINMEGWFVPANLQGTTMVWASLETTIAGKNTFTAPSDLYLQIQQDPQVYRIDRDTTGAIPENWFGGSIDVGGKDGDAAKALAPAVALATSVPMLVHLVFDGPSHEKSTLAFSVVNDLPSDQKLALAKCYADGAKIDKP